MTPLELDECLKQTLEDFRLSRGERRALQSIIEDQGADDNQLAFLRHRAFEIARNEVLGPQAHAVLGWLEDVVKALQPQSEPTSREPQAYFSPGDQCVSAVTGALRHAKRTVDICVFTITDNRISDAIVDSHRRRVRVRIITDNDKAEDLGSDVIRLDECGIPVRVDRSSNHMHHKYAIVDNECLITGSYNWTRSASEYNEENIVALYERVLIRQFSDHFDKLWTSLG